MARQGLWNIPLLLSSPPWSLYVPFLEYIHGSYFDVIIASKTIGRIQ